MTDLAYFQRDALIWESCLKPLEKLVLHCLNSFVGSDGQCFPKQSRIADMTSLSRKTVISVLFGLEEQGVIKSQQRIRKAGGKSSKTYELDWGTLNFFQGKRPKGRKPNPGKDSCDVKEGYIECEGELHRDVKEGYNSNYPLPNCPKELSKISNRQFDNCPVALEASFSEVAKKKEEGDLDYPGDSAPNQTLGYDPKDSTLPSCPQYDRTLIPSTLATTKEENGSASSSDTPASLLGSDPQLSMLATTTDPVGLSTPRETRETQGEIKDIQRRCEERQMGFRVEGTPASSSSSPDKQEHTSRHVGSSVQTKGVSEAILGEGDSVGCDRELSSNKPRPEKRVYWNPEGDDVPENDQGIVQFPSRDQVPPKLRRRYGITLSRTIRDTQLWLIQEELVYDICIEDGEVHSPRGVSEPIEDALAQNGQYPLQKLRDLALDERYGCLMVNEFNEHIVECFRDRWDEMDES